MKDIEYWFRPDEVDGLYTSAYWNDIQTEKSKPFWIQDGKFDECLNYLNDSGLLCQYDAAVGMMDIEGNEGLVVADLASGIGWASAALSCRKEVAKVISVEMSKHRLELGERSCEMMGGDSGKIERCLGSFYDLKLESHSVDRVLMVQAFHHADRPLHLLVEIDRVLKPGGRVVIAGEHALTFLSMLKRMGHQILKNRNLQFSSQDLWPPDATLGDHFYLPGDYQLFFQCMGYDLVLEKLPSHGGVLVCAGCKPT